MKTKALSRSQLFGLLFALCWLAYFTAYLGRLNYGAVIAEIVAAEGWSNSACGLVSTGFFICYGVGQLFSGVVGDRVPVRTMIFVGLVVSALCNLTMGFLQTPGAMLWVWCLNGVAQSMTWAPILRAFAEYLPVERRGRACVDISTTYPIGTLATYGLSAGVILLWGWRMVFGITAVFMLAVAAVWWFGFGVIQRSRATLRRELPHPVDGAALPPAMPLGRLAVLVLCCIGLALAMQGALRDGVMTWIPTYLSATFGVGSTLSIFATMALPVVNLGGAYLASFISRRLGRDELQTAFLLFVLGGGAAVLLAVFGGSSLLFSVAAFAVVTACMTGTNVMLVHVIPTYFVSFGRVATVSGVVNATVYIGSSIATFGIGAIADRFGWSTLLVVLCFVAGAGAVICLAAAPLWRRFVASQQ